MDLLGIGFALGTALFWSIAQIFGKFALRSISALTFNTIRVVTALPLCFFVVLLLKKYEPLPITMIFFLLIAGILAWNVGAQLLFFILERESLHRISPIANSFPVGVYILSTIFLDERVTVYFFVSLVLVLIGLWFLSPPEEGEDKKKRANSLVISLALLTSVVWAISVVMTKYYLRYTNPLNTAFWKILGGTFVFLLMFNINLKRKNNTKIPGLNKSSLKYSVLSGISLLLGEISYTFGLERMLASHVSLFTNAQIPFIFLLSVIFLREKPSLIRYFGMTLIFLGLIVLVSA